MNVCLIIFCLLFFGCSSKNDSAVEYFARNKDAVTEDKDLPDEVCGLLTKELIANYFDIDEGELEFEDKYVGTNYHQCGFKWEKSNFEELKDSQRKAFKMFIKSSTTSLENNELNELSLSDVLMMESPYAFVQVGQFNKFKSVIEAETVFSTLYDKPNGEEVLLLNKAFFSKEFNLENLEIDHYRFNKLIEEFKFKEIKGVGDQAYYDMINKSVNVRFGTLTFRVYIDSEFDISTNIEIGKSIALAVWEKL